VPLKTNRVASVRRYSQVFDSESFNLVILTIYGSAGDVINDEI